ncbi:hypothetical protein HMPREF9944_00171 [Segatella maculosa OT 289]|uniref:Uncharacterized protein n=1 Tax=Segatella maculosa OT 289 TaxID=999422 RepID=H1HJ38_9BACT|nr:hypothetical protein HMPREF9944_00171 [Segatella maculosa OT 289]
MHMAVEVSKRLSESFDFNHTFCFNVSWISALERESKKQ